MATLEYDNVRYTVLIETTAQSAAAEGLTHLAKDLAARGMAQLYLYRTNGRKMFVAYRDDAGRITRPTPLAGL